MLRISTRKIQAFASARRTLQVNKFSTVGATDAETYEERAKTFIKEHGVTIRGNTTEYHPMLSFEESPFAEKIKKVLKKEGFMVPSPIQALSWPVALDKKDIISVAKTGSGECFLHVITIYQL